MGMAYNRDALEHLIKHIPEHSKGAEIGVWHGNTSLAIVRNRKPKHIHLVDPWSIAPYREGSEHGTFKQYLARYASMVKSDSPDDFQAHYDRIHLRVTNRFKEYKGVTIHRMTSEKWFDSFNDKLDWIYLDGNHSFGACFADLCCSLEIVRKGGFIFGDDYRWTKIGKPGLTKAVDLFKLKGFAIKRIGKCHYRFVV